jgi:HD-like signal output (HDOD) protein
MVAGLSIPACPVLLPADIARSVKHLPSAPKILPRLKLLLHDGNSALDEIVTLIRLDPGLAMRVLQVANSPYFFTGARCLTIDEAVRRVGYDEIYALASYAVAAQVLNRPLAVYGIEPNASWARSVGAALAAEAIAEFTGDDPAVAYTVGLLHGIGMIAIDEWSLRTGRGLKFTVSGFPAEATEDERRALGFTQADAGAALLREWEFPDEIVEPVRSQYGPAQAATHARLTGLLSAAKWIRAAVLQRPKRLPAPTEALAVLRPFGLKATQLNALVSLVGHQLTWVSSTLEEIEDSPVDRHLFPAQSWHQ